MPSGTRNKRATWVSTSALGWSKPRLIHELQNGLPYCTYPRGISVDWHHPDVLRSLDVERSEVTITRGVVAAEAVVPGEAFGLGIDRLTVGIEVLWPPAAPAAAKVPAPSASAPVASPARKRPSDAAVKKCFLAIKKERPDDPPNEEWLLTEMKQRLGASPVRQRVRNLWQDIAPEWKKPVGAPSKKISAKKSAV